jgi:two-component system LytT family response regulator
MTEVLKIRALIVDDEALPRRYILESLESHPEVETIGECANGYEAIAAIREHAPDLVFLDVKMPELDGFDVLKKLAPEPLPLVIFVTVYNEYAVKAFEFSAVDYLLKPFNQERFDEALQKAKRTLATEKTGELTERMLALLERVTPETKAKPSALEWLVIKCGMRDLLIKTKEIDWVEADGKNTWLHVGPRSHLSPKAIGLLEAQLDPKIFARGHRSFIVNINFVKEILHPSERKGYRVALKNGKELDLSLSGRDKLNYLLGADL